MSFLLDGYDALWVNLAFLFIFLQLFESF